MYQLCESLSLYRNVGIHQAEVSAQVPSVFLFLSTPAKKPRVVLPEADETKDVSTSELQLLVLLGQLKLMHLLFYKEEITHKLEIKEGRWLVKNVADLTWKCRRLWCCSVLKHLNFLAFNNTVTFAEAFWFIVEGAWGRKGGVYPSQMLDIVISLLILFPFKKFHLSLHNKWIDADSGGRAV